MAVEDDQQRLAAGVPDVGGRDDDLDALVGTRVAAVDRQVDDLGPRAGRQGRGRST